MSVLDLRVTELPKITDPRGNLTVVESNIQVPFEIKRAFFIYDVPTGVDRGAHAHRTLFEFLICLSGSFDVSVDDGHHQRKIHLNRPWHGLLVPPLIWAAEVNFDPGSVCLVLASHHYDENDYIRDYQEFLTLNGVKA